MQMRGWLTVAFAVTTLMVLGGCERDLSNPSAEQPASQVGVAENTVPQVDWKVELTGSGLTKPTTFTYAQLARREMVQLDNVLMQKTHDENSTNTWRGPALAALLADAGLKPGPMTLTFAADDGYSKDMSLADVSDAIIAMQDGEGRWLAEIDKKCPLLLVPPRKPGDYWVMYLNRITVKPVAEDRPAE